MKLFAMLCGHLRCRKRIFLPDTNKEDFVNIPMPAFLITHPKGNVLVDTGPNPDVYNDPFSAWGNLAKAFEPILKKNDDILSQLERIEIRPEDIKYVVNTHLHFDHAGGNRLFKESMFLVSVHELEWAQRPENEGKGYFKEDWNHPLNYKKLEGVYDIFNDDQITIMPMPGHTPGHQVVIVRLKHQGTIILSGDSVPFKENYENKIISINNTDDVQVSSSVNKVTKILKEKNATLIHGHDPKQWQTIKIIPECYS